MAQLSARDVALFKLMGQNAQADSELVEEPPMGMVNVGPPKEIQAEPTPMQNQPIIQEQVAPRQPSSNSGLRKRYDQALEQDFAAQQEGVDQQNRALEEQLKLAQANQQTNLAPAYDLLNSWYGLDAGKSYKAKDAAPDMQRTQQLMGLLQESKQKLTGSRTQALKALLEDEQKRSEDGKAKRSEDRFSYQIQKDFKNDIEKNITNPAQEISKDFSQIDAAIKPDANGQVDLRDVNLVLSQYAKTVAGLKGVLSDTDVKTISLTNLETDLANLQRKFGSDAKVDASIFAPWVKQVGIAKDTSRVGFERALKNKSDFYSDPSFVGGSALFAGKEGGIAGRSLKESDKTLKTIFGNSANAQSVPAPGIDPEFEAWYAAQQGKK